jgi:hypothetical protein
MVIPVYSHFTDEISLLHPFATRWAGFAFLNFPQVISLYIPLLSED